MHIGLLLQGKSCNNNSANAMYFNHYTIRYGNELLAGDDKDI